MPCTIHEMANAWRFALLPGRALISGAMTAVSRAGGLPWSRAAVLGLVLLVACRPACQRPPDAATRSVAAPVSSGATGRVLDGGASGPRAQRSLPVVFPLRPAPGGRHLEDQRGTPFLIKGETAWLARRDESRREAEQEAYLADRGGDRASTWSR